MPKKHEFDRPATAEEKALGLDPAVYTRDQFRPLYQGKPGGSTPDRSQEMAMAMKLMMEQAGAGLSSREIQKQYPKIQRADDFPSDFDEDSLPTEDDLLRAEELGFKIYPRRD